MLNLYQKWVFLFLLFIFGGLSVAIGPPLLATQSSDQSSRDHFLPGFDFLATPSITGVAHRLGDFSPIYTEKYFPAVETNNLLQRLRVIYSEIIPSDQLSIDQGKPQSRVFAVKDVDYAQSAIAPAYTIADFRLGKVQHALHLPNNKDEVNLAQANITATAKSEFFSAQSSSALEMVMASTRRLVDEQASGTILQEEAREIDAYLELDRQGSVSRKNLVTDAGFDQFIRLNWQELNQEKLSIPFRFAVPGRGQAVGMKIEALDTVACKDKVLSDIPATIESLPAEFNCFELEATSWIIAKILKPIYLVYDDSKRLMAFRGLSNIRGAGNKRQRVYIRYSYSDTQV